jgi:hypothetical protein
MPRRCCGIVTIVFLGGQCKSCFFCQFFKNSLGGDCSGCNIGNIPPTPAPTLAPAEPEPEEPEPEPSNGDEGEAPGGDDVGESETEPEPDDDEGEATGEPEPEPEDDEGEATDDGTEPEPEPEPVSTPSASTLPPCKLGSRYGSVAMDTRGKKADKISESNVGSSLDCSLACVSGMGIVPAQCCRQ